MARGLTGDPIVIGQELFSSSATQVHDLGTRAVDGYGRKFRYVQAGASALVVGNMIQAFAEIANHRKLVVPAQTGYYDDRGVLAGAIGSQALRVTPGATAGAANLYAGGWLCVDTAGTGSAIGYMYPIKGHAAITSATDFTLNLDLPLQAAIVAGQNTVTLVGNPYKNVIQAPVTTLTGAVVGAAVYPIAASEYGWIQTGGPSGVLVKGTPGPGLAVVCPGTVAGGVVVDGAASETPVVGYMMITATDAKAAPVFLTID